MKLARVFSTALFTALLAVLVLDSGCTTNKKVLYQESHPGKTKFGSKTSVVNGHLIGRHFIIEAKWDRRGPWHFLVDTGSSVTLVSPEFASRYGIPARNLTPTAMQVKSADGSQAVFPGSQIAEMKLGDVSFQNVPVLVSNHDEISAHLDQKIDGILGYPFFNDTVFSLDYAQGRLVISDPAAAAPAGAALPINSDQHTPVALLPIGQDFFPILIDTGSDAALVLNPNGKEIKYAIEPRTGGSVGSLLGDSFHQVARLSEGLRIGDNVIPTPVTTLTRQMSAIGGDILKFFTVTFRPKDNEVWFVRNDTPLKPEVLRSCGLSFSKTPAYWRILGVIAGSPAEKAGIRNGDLVVRINGEPVSKWPLPRFDALVNHSSEITFTLLQGSRETPVILSSFDLVPLSSLP